MIISLPVFGEYHRNLFLETTLPRLLPCVGSIEDVRWLIHSDSEDMVTRLRANNTIRKVEYRPCFGGYEAFRAAHQEAFAEAVDGETVFFLCADMVLSSNAFTYAIDRIASGDLAVVIAGPRTLAPEPPKIGSGPDELLTFAMRYPHPITRDCFFPWGQSSAPTYVYFTRDGRSITLRAMHLHPFAVVKRPVQFKGTVDSDLLNDYPRDRIHIVQNREIACVELSPPGKRVGTSGNLTIEAIASCYKDRCSDLHKWYFDHPIRIAGEGECGDTEIVAAVQRTA